MNAIRTLAEYIPPKARTIIYSILGLAIALEAIWDVVPAELDGKVLATVSALGFGLAAANTRSS